MDAIANFFANLFQQLVIWFQQLFAWLEGLFATL